MKRILFFFFGLFTTLVVAQTASPSVAFFVGSGDQTAYFVADFKDQTDDRSYVWGIRFTAADAPTGVEMLEIIAAAEPAFSFEQSSGFLDQIAFNSHDSYAQAYDFWSLWVSGDGLDWQMAGWMSSTLENGRWYGASYGWNNPSLEAPTYPLPAYSSQWFSLQEVALWVGEGAHESVVVIDFGTQTGETPDSFAIGIRYNGSISGNAALALIENAVESFAYTTGSNRLISMELGEFIATSPAQTASYYTGTNLSNWQSREDLTAITLGHGDWLGIGWGDRRPYWPQAYAEALASDDWHRNAVYVYPNPSAAWVYFTAQAQQNYELYNALGQFVAKGIGHSVDLTGLTTGVYYLHMLDSNSNLNAVFPIVKK